LVRFYADVSAPLGRSNPSVTYGNSRIQLTTDAHLLASLSVALDRDCPSQEVYEHNRLFILLLKDELFRVHTWLSPVSSDPTIGPVTIPEEGWPEYVRSAWKINRLIAVHLSERFSSNSLDREIQKLVFLYPEEVIDSPLAAQILLGERLSPDLLFQLRVTHFVNGG